MQKLALELGVSNSLQLSNLYTYLLWNGYLSKNKTNIYSEERKLLEGLFFVDVMDGIGVCLNYADMLKDFLKACDHEAAVLWNLCDARLTTDYIVPIEKKVC